MGISQALGNVGQIPVGSVVPFAGTAAPANWLLCAGQAVSRVDFAGLFLTIGTTYGVGDGSTTFNVPDLRGRVVAGVDNMNGSAAGRLTNTVLTASNTIGATGGAQVWTLTTDQIPQVASATHRHDFAISIMDNNFMPTGQMGGLLGAGAYRYSTSSWASATGPVGTFSNLINTGGTGGVSATTGRFQSVGDTTTPSGVTGGGQQHLNTQPTLVMNYLIRAA